ncbi:outer dense fiber protein 3-like [Physella acuta]|uniref:outer dense fiber protein 3-like n=1 Tax=Physella acuta TaxID=109671 RepID=UPI0027DC1E84|nr:outer dense fiber protein 3-like [Physella acuta]XP_059149202.1 outer dense fiber protein 3-like [Physella acuta]
MPKAKGPGPNHYLLPSTVGMVNHDPTRPKAPGYSFGTRYSYAYANGPGYYYLQSGLYNNGKENKDGFTLYGRPRRSIWENSSGNSPGPVYAVSTAATEKKTPSYSFGAPYKHNYKTEGPGPGTYTVLKPWDSSKKGPLLSGRLANSQSFDYDFAKTPGPARYGYNKTSTGPAYSIGKRTQLPGNKLITPGPNTYLPPLNGTQPNSPRFSMGIRHHEDVMVVPEVDIDSY